MTRRSARLSGAAFATLLAAAATLGLAAPAQAHNYPVTSTPEAGSTVTELPEVFSVTTNEALLDLTGSGTGFAIQVIDEAGRYYGDGCLTVADSTLSMGASLGAAGNYRVLWQVVSEDGHTVSDEFGFTWAPSAGAAVSEGATAPPVCGAVEPTPTATATDAPTSTPEPTVVPEVPENANLSDVLWVGGAILAVLVAGLVTFLILGRKKKD